MTDSTQQDHEDTDRQPRNKYRFTKSAMYERIETYEFWAEDEDEASDNAGEQDPDSVRYEYVGGDYQSDIEEISADEVGEIVTDREAKPRTDVH
jgi:hypothetical protein